MLVGLTVVRIYLEWLTQLPKMEMIEFKIGCLFVAAVTPSLSCYTCGQAYFGDCAAAATSDKVFDCGIEHVGACGAMLTRKDGKGTVQ